MSKEFQIIRFVSIVGGRVLFNGETLYSDEDQQQPYNEFTKGLYKTLEINYPKFYKMDPLCKLAFLSSEILLKGISLQPKYLPSEIAITLFNSASSLATDLKFQETINDKSNYFPNPSLFVYTLPNIMIGEICIRNNFKGENTLLVFNNFESELMFDYIENLIVKDKTKCVIGGWIDFDPFKEERSAYESFLFLVEANDPEGKDFMKFEKNNICNLYQSGRK